MLDIRYIRANPDTVQQSTRAKGYDVDISQLLKVDDDRRSLGQRVDELRERRNQNAAKMKGGKPEQSLIDEGKQIKIELAEQERYLTDLDTEYKTLLHSVPNIITDDVPLGGEEDSVEIKQFGEKKTGAKDILILLLRAIGWILNAVRKWRVQSFIM